MESTFPYVSHLPVCSILAFSPQWSPAGNRTLKYDLIKRHHKFARKLSRMHKPTCRECSSRACPDAPGSHNSQALQRKSGSSVSFGTQMRRPSFRRRCSNKEACGKTGERVHVHVSHFLTGTRSDFKHKPMVQRMSFENAVPATVNVFR